MKILRLVAILILASIPFFACGGTDSPTSPPPSTPNDGPVIISLVGFSFSSANITIPLGTTVRWVNGSNTFHTVTPDGHSQWQRAETSSQGTVLEVTFNTIGIFNYFCEPHVDLGMIGRITVQ